MTRSRDLCTGPSCRPKEPLRIQCHVGAARRRAAAPDPTERVRLLPPMPYTTAPPPPHHHRSAAWQHDHRTRTRCCWLRHSPRARMRWRRSPRSESRWPRPRSATTRDDDRGPHGTAVAAPRGPRSAPEPDRADRCDDNAAPVPLRRPRAVGDRGDERSGTAGGGAEARRARSTSSEPRWAPSRRARPARRVLPCTRQDEGRRRAGCDDRRSCGARRGRPAERARAAPGPGPPGAPTGRRSSSSDASPCAAGDPAGRPPGPDRRSPPGPGAGLCGPHSRPTSEQDRRPGRRGLQWSNGSPWHDVHRPRVRIRAPVAHPSGVIGHRQRPITRVVGLRSLRPVNGLPTISRRTGATGRRTQLDRGPRGSNSPGPAPHPFAHTGGIAGHHRGGAHTILSWAAESKRARRCGRHATSATSRSRSTTRR